MKSTPDRDSEALREEQAEEADRRTRSLAGLAISLVLVVLGLLLVQRLAETSKLQDCMMGGRTNCEPLETSDAANR